FSALVVLLFAFAFTREGIADWNAVAGVVWIAVAFAGTLGLGRAMDREREGATLRALLLSPIDRSAIYVGKLLGITAFMLLADLPTAWFWARMMLAFDAVFVTLSLWVYEPLIAVE